MRMQRIVIIGSSGSGKPILAKDLGIKLNLPVINLGQLYWYPGRATIVESIWQEKIRQLVRDEQWIIAGNYLSTLDIRLKAADTIVYLDLFRVVCGYRATKLRLQRQKPAPTTDKTQDVSIFMPDFSGYMKRVWQYPNESKPIIEQHLFELDPKTRIIHLKRRSDIQKFVQDPIMFASRIHSMPLAINS